MKRIIFNIILIFTIHEIFSTVKATEYESSALNRELDELCSSYMSHKKDKLIKDLSEQSHAKDAIIRELSEKLVRQKGNDALIKQLQSQINFQMKLITGKNEEITKINSQIEVEKSNNLQSQMDFHKQTIDKLTASLKLSEHHNKCKDELANESKKLQICVFQLNKVNSSLIEKNEIISRNNMKIQKNAEDQKAIELKLEQSQANLMNKEKDHKLCQIKFDILNRTAQNNIPSSCLPFGEYPGVHKIKVSDLKPFYVLCDSQLAGPGWLVMQQQVGGNESFDRSWASYRDGFGSLESDFFLGLEKIHRLTNSRRYELYIHLVAANGTITYARYDDFKISDEDNGYALNLGQFEGNDEDAMREVDRRKFTTFDRDNDLAIGNCALDFKSGWWYNNCYRCNLNTNYGEYFRWYPHDELQKVKMLIRPKD